MQKGLKSVRQCMAEASGQPLNGKHWSDVFYDSAREAGYKYAARINIPNFVDRDYEETDLQGFNWMMHLYQLPFVKLWDTKDLLRFELHDRDNADALLVAYMKDGTHWVVAYFKQLRPDTKLELLGKHIWQLMGQMKERSASASVG